MIKNKSPKHEDDVLFRGVVIVWSFLMRYCLNAVLV